MLSSRQKKMLAVTVIFIIMQGAFTQPFETTTPKQETWTGRWLPERPSTEKPSTESTVTPDLRDDFHSVRMGIASIYCDDAHTNLTVDWNFSPLNYTCYTLEKKIPDVNLRPLLEHENIPRFYVAQHRCMDQPIEYDVLLPTFGTHRPLWPRYGEYKFVPRQRWLHNLEHGAIVALYHPCAHPLEVNRLRTTISRCLWRHVISPSNLVDEERPFVILSWGWRLTLSSVQTDVIQDFIKEHALKGPEQINRDGQFEVGLLRPAKLVSTPDDEILCPS